MVKSHRKIEEVNGATYIECTKCHQIDVYNTGDNIIGVEIPGRYDGIAYRFDQDTGQRYSRAGYPIANDEVCRRGNIYKVEFYDERGIKYKILSRRPDTNEGGRNS